MPGPVMRRAPVKKSSWMPRWLQTAIETDPALTPAALEMAPTVLIPQLTGAGRANAARFVEKITTQGYPRIAETVDRFLNRYPRMAAILQDMSASHKLDPFTAAYWPKGVTSAEAAEARSVGILNRPGIVLSSKFEDLPAGVPARYKSGEEATLMGILRHEAGHGATDLRRPQNLFKDYGVLTDQFGYTGNPLEVLARATARKAIIGRNPAGHYQSIIDEINRSVTNLHSKGIEPEVLAAYMRNNYRIPVMRNPELGPRLSLSSWFGPQKRPMFTLIPQAEREALMGLLKP